MFKKTIKQQAVEVLTENPELVKDHVSGVMADILRENPEIVTNILTDNPELITEHMEVIFTEPKNIKAFEKALDIARAQRIRREFEDLLDELEEEEIKMENTTTPWYQLAVCEAYDEDKGWPMKVFCNSAFLKEIEKQGIARASKEEMTYNWLNAVRNID